jgi:hypothetical protein
LFCQGEESLKPGVSFLHTVGPLCHRPSCIYTDCRRAHAGHAGHTPYVWDLMCSGCIDKCVCMHTGSTAFTGRCQWLTAQFLVVPVQTVVCTVTHWEVPMTGDRFWAGEWVGPGATQPDASALCSMLPSIPGSTDGWVRTHPPHLAHLVSRSGGSPRSTFGP